MNDSIRATITVSYEHQVHFTHGAFDVIARLPLAANYATTFRNFDVERQKLKLKQLKVLGIESVTVLPKP